MTHVLVLFFTLDFFFLIEKGQIWDNFISNVPFLNSDQGSLRKKFLQQARIPWLPHLSYRLCISPPRALAKVKECSLNSYLFRFVLGSEVRFCHSHSYPQKLYHPPWLQSIRQPATSLGFHSAIFSLLLANISPGTTDSPPSLLLTLRNVNMYSFPKRMWKEQKVLDILVSAW